MFGKFMEDRLRVIMRWIVGVGPIEDKMVK